MKFFFIIIIKSFIMVLCIFTIVNSKKRPITDSASFSTSSCSLTIVIVPYGYWLFYNMINCFIGIVVGFAVHTSPPLLLNVTFNCSDLENLKRHPFLAFWSTNLGVNPLWNWPLNIVNFVRSDYIHKKTQFLLRSLWNTKSRSDRVSK